VIEDEAGIRASLGQRQHFIQLGVIGPDVQRQVVARQQARACAEVVLRQQTARWRLRIAADGGIGMPGRGIADAAQAAVAGLLQGFDHSLHFGPSIRSAKPTMAAQARTGP
jgi:hypothetical protein